MVLLILPHLVLVFLACCTLGHSDPCGNDVWRCDCVIEELAKYGDLGPSSPLWKYLPTLYRTPRRGQSSDVQRALLFGEVNPDHTIYDQYRAT